jgi:endoglucanase
MLAALNDCASYMQDNSDVWMGWTYWSGGPWWGNYMYSIEPTNIGQPNQTDSPQMHVLGPYF